MKKRSLLEIVVNWSLVGFSILAIASVVLGFLVPLIGSGESNKRHAEEEARTFAADLYPGQNHRVSCMSTDTDGNGYVSCTLIVREQPIPIECANRYSITRNTGCRPMRITVMPGSP